MGSRSPAAAAGRQPAPTGPGPVLIKATPIARLPERSVAAELQNARLAPGDPALGAGAVRYGIVVYRVLYRTIDAAGRPTRASGLVAFPAGHALQQGTLPGFRLRALAPVSGPYDLPGAQLPGIFNGQIAAAVAPYYVGYTLTAWNPLYHIYRAPGDVFRRPYAASVEQLFDGTRPDQQIIAALPPRLQALITARYLRLLQHPTGALRTALIRNSTCTGWTPRVPVRLYAASGDTTVTQVNAQHCLQAIRARHGRARLVQLGAVSHNISDFLALPQIVRWFQTFR